MGTFFLFCTAILLAGALPARGASPSTCIRCHQGLDDEELVAPVTLMKQDIHARQGLSCADCHGGDPASDDEDESMDEETGFVGLPDKEDLPRFCGKCHADAAYMRRYNPTLRVDQVALYRTSVHGKRLLEEGDTKVAACVDCHGAHGILPAADPRSPVYPGRVPGTCGRCHSDPIYMQEYGIPTDQYAQYRRSVHGRPLLAGEDPGAPACNDCHGSHGATPPGVNSLANVCARCHPINGELLSQSPHRAAFEKLGIAACETCHSHHDIEPPGDAMVGAGAPAVCANCHRPDKWPKGLVAAHTMRTALDTLSSQLQKASELCERVERKGMGVGEIKYELNEAAGRLTRARSMLHSFDPRKVEALSKEGLKWVASASRKGGAALEELRFRRRGLGLSLVVITLVGLALFVKIRTLEEERRP